MTDFFSQTLTDSLIYFARQELPTRGHDESLVSENRGNFKELLDLVARHSDNFLRISNQRPGNATYTSPDIQNELLELCAEQVVEKIIAQVKESKYFSIMADETTDTSKHTQLSMFLRYNKDGKYYTVYSYSQLKKIS